MPHFHARLGAEVEIMPTRLPVESHAISSQKCAQNMVRGVAIFNVSRRRTTD